MDLDRRSFVEKVDFITSVGYLDGGASREAAGLGPGGPRYVIPDKASFDFTPDTREMRLRSLHPGVSVHEVLDFIGIAPVIPDHVTETEPPTEGDLALIRNEPEPNRILTTEE